ncbi:MAG: protein phosphatase 2C domain-containing protein [Flavobacteriia bacterium]|nr:protein phosphatase 2C domain-containing protein [Flavobacteriia bacterium]
MSASNYILSLLENKKIISADIVSDFIKAFSEDKENISLAEQIIQNQNLIMMNFKLKSRIEDIKRLSIPLKNGTVGKDFKSVINYDDLNLSDLIFTEFRGLEEIGLKYNEIEDSIEGNPIQSGDHNIQLLFRIDGENEDSELNIKEFSIIINPDPKSLWKDIESDKNDPFWKDDNVSTVDIVGEKKIVIASKRGRSHANVGSFRDDDFAYKYFNNSGWTVVAVSDGAGSYSLSRKGSEIACNAVVEYFEKHSDIDLHKDFEDKLLEFDMSRDEVLLNEIQILAKKNLYKATVFAHNEIKEFADKLAIEKPELFNNPKAKSPIDYFHSTLIFTLFKKFDFGYLVLTFGVGDCPIAIVNKDKTITSLMNWLDVGEFGGGTRFITQPEIFHSESNPMATRFNFQIFPDFSYLFLMTDGIYDPKFVVEANLEKNEKWQEFISDLEGNNDDKSKVNFNYANEEIDIELSKWMDFWSPGNHDDRTLAIIY